MSINQNKPKIIFLMGPTASGKTPLAIESVQRLPLEIISVDSAMVYRGMDIGTAKPDAATLKIAPHRLIDICDPADAYSAGRFRVDAMREIKEIHAHGKIPLLVGGTMLYFRALLHGLAELPRADEDVRAELTARAEREGWEALHAELAKIDPAAAAKIHGNDAQRIQRALEVYTLTGQPISSLQIQEQSSLLSNYDVRQFALMPSDRAMLHERIAKRFDLMLKQGLLEEVKMLMARGDLSPELPSIRSVGYRQVWDYLSGKIDEATMRDAAIAATRQLAKRQMTWLRTWPGCEFINPDDRQLLDSVIRIIFKWAEAY